MILWYLTTSNRSNKNVAYKFPGNFKCVYQVLVQDNVGRIYNNALGTTGSTSTVFIYYVSTMKSNIIKYSVINRSDFPSIHVQNKIPKLFKAGRTRKQQYFSLWHLDKL